MHKTLITLLLIFAAVMANCQSLTVNFNYGCFSTADGETYLETYLMIPQNELKHVKTADGHFNSAAQVTMIFKDNNEISDFLKYELTGIPTSDTLNITNNIIDQQRIFLENSSYLLELTVKDKNDTTKIVKGDVVFSMGLPKDVVSSSTICFIDTYSKSNNKSMITRGGYDMIPYFSTYFPETRDKLTYYNEIYNIDKFLGENSRMAIMSYIESYENAGHIIEGSNKIQVDYAKPVTCLLNNINIKTLPTGNYWLVISVLDESGKEVIKTKKFFQRYNPEYELSENMISAINLTNSFASKFTSVDTLRSIIHSMMPKATLSERPFINKVDTVTNIEIMQQFISMFWSERDELAPEQAFNNYMGEVKKVNATYGNVFRKGYDTDRGRIYLQYGPPNHKENNVIPASTIPYEIWQYYEIAGQRDKRFVFATHDAAIKDYDLVHSDVIGEIHNPKWQFDLYHNAPIINDDTEYEEIWGQHLQRTFDNPY